MRRSIRLAGALLVLTAASGTSFALAAVDDVEGPARVANPAFRLEPPDRQPTSYEARAADAIVQAVNAERGKRGLPLLHWHDQVGAAAQGHADDMAAHARMQHAGSDSSNAGDRLERAGYTWNYWGENVGAGFNSAETLVQAWMNSPSHRSHLLGDFTYIGVGASATPAGVPYWDLVVAR